MSSDDILMTMEFEGTAVEIRRVYWYMFYSVEEVSDGDRRGWVTSAVTGPTHNDLTLGWLMARLDGDPRPDAAILAEAGRSGNNMYQIFHFPTSAHYPEIWVKRFVVTPDKDLQSDVPGACTIKGTISVTHSLEKAQALVADIKAKAAVAGRAKQEPQPAGAVP